MKICVSSLWKMEKQQGKYGISALMRKFVCARKKISNKNHDDILLARESGRQLLFSCCWCSGSFAKIYIHHHLQSTQLLFLSPRSSHHLVGCWRWCQRIRKRNLSKNWKSLRILRPSYHLVGYPSRVVSMYFNPFNVD